MDPHCFSRGPFRFMLPLVLVASLLGACTVESSGGSRGARSNSPAVTLTFEAQANVLSIPEDSAAGASAGELKATVDSEDGKVSFSIAKNDWFELDEATVKLKGDTSLDYETTPSHKIVVTAEAKDAGKITLTLLVTVTNVHESVITFAPDAQSLNIPEDASPGDAVGTLTASTDGPGSVSFSLAENDRFELDGATVKLKSDASLDHETATSHQIVITAHAEDAVNIPLNLLVTVTNVLESTITFAAAAQSLSIAEDASAGDSAGTLLASTDGPDSVSFGLAENDRFELDGAAVKLKSGAGLDHETATSHQIVITAQAKDADDVTHAISVAVIEVFEHTITFAAAAQSLSIAENASPGDSAGTLLASTDGPDSVSFSLAENDRFELDGAAVKLKSGASLDFEVATSHQIVVTAEAADAAGVTHALLVIVTNVIDSTITFAAAAQGLSIAENASPGDSAGTLVASTDGPGTVSFSMAAHALFELGGAIVKLKSGALLDFEVATSHQIVITAHAKDADDVTHAISVAIIEVFANTITFAAAAQSLSIAETAPPGYSAGTLVASTDGPGAVSLSIVDNDWFELDGAVVKLKSDATLDFEVATSHQIVIIARAEEAADVTRTLSVAVIAVPNKTIAFAAAAQSLSIPEAASPGDSAGTLVANVDGPVAVSFSIAENSRFELDGAAVRLKDGATLDYEVATSHSITVTARVMRFPDVTRTLPVAVTPSVQDGSASNPYRVNTHSKLKSMSSGFVNRYVATHCAAINKLSGSTCRGRRLDMATTLRSHYVVTANINAASTSSIAGFPPIGRCKENDCSDPNRREAFTGQFDGQGFTISGLAIDLSDTNGVGIFAVLGEGGIITDLVLKGGRVLGNKQVGALVGYNDGGTITDIISSNAARGQGEVGGLVGYNEGGTVGRSETSAITAGRSSSSRENIGGLVGVNHGGTVHHSVALGPVQGDRNLGGLVGYNRGADSTITNSEASGRVLALKHDKQAIGGLVGKNEGTISDSVASGDVSGNTEVGGLVGSTSGSVRGSEASGRVLADGDQAGGLIGFNSDGEISDSVASGNVVGNTEVGGLVGSTSGSVRGSEASGRVVADGNQAGGLIGHNSDGEISNSRALGNVKGTEYVGGLIGFNSHGEISDSRALGNARGTEYVGGLIGHNNGKISDSRALGNARGTEYVGGLIGHNNGKISDSRALGNVRGTGQVGGLVGRSSYAPKIAYSFASGKVSGNSRVGGLIGDLTGGTVTCSFATGTVSGNGSVGGLVGHSKESTVRSSFATGTVSGGSDSVGGLVGQSRGSTVQDSFARGDIVGPGDGGRFGGLIGRAAESSIVSRSFATGDLRGGRYSGGLIGETHGSSKVTDVYATGAVRETAYTGGLIGNNDVGKLTQRGYCLAESGPYEYRVDGCVGGGKAGENVFRTTEMYLRQLGCDQAVFEDCSTNWNMGSLSQLPVPRANLLTAADFKRLEDSDFASLDATNPGTNELEMDASGLITKRFSLDTLGYAWNLPAGVSLAEEDILSDASIAVTVADPSAAYTLHLTIVEFNYYGGEVFRVYTDEVVISAP